MIPAYRSNPRPMDGPNLPADWATTSRRGTIRLALLVAGLFVAVMMAMVAVS